MDHPLVSVADLARALAGPRPPTVLDVRWDLRHGPQVDEYRQGHVPTARFVDLDRDLAGPPGPGRHPLPAMAEFEAAMRRCGVDDERPVIVYDAGDSMAAARAWWLLRYFGHSAVAVLDGGLRAWLAAGLPLEEGEPPPARGGFHARPGGMPLLDARAAAAVARSGVLLDARAPERYRGEVEPIDPVAGHIPGAVNAPTSANVGEDGRFLDPGALRERFAALGIRPDVPVGVYCGSGVTAAHEVLALALVGIDAGLYVGSWSDWITDPTRPIATGPDPG